MSALDGINKNASTSLAGNFKEVYRTGDITTLVPGIAKLASIIPFSQRDLIGNKFHIPLRTQDEHSIVGSVAGTTPSWTTAFEYINGVVADAQIDGSQLLARAAVDYEAIYKSKSDKAAFAKATAEVVKALSASAAKRREAMLLHGRKGWGTIESVSGTDIVITAATWAPGLWAGCKGMQLDAYASDGTTARTNSAADAISSITMSTRTITLGNSVDGSWVAGDLLFPQSFSGTVDFIGLSAIAQNTGALYGVTSELMQGNVVDTSTGLPSMAKLLNAASAIADFAGDGRIIAVMSPKAFEVMNSDQAAMRRYPQASSQGKNGFKGLSFETQVGELALLPHPYAKQGEIILFTEGETYRIGATDLNFIRRGRDGEEMLSLEVTNAGAGEMRVYASQALVVEQARHTAYLGGCTY